MKMRRCEDEKMFHRPPLLEEPCAQTLLGKKSVDSVRCFVPKAWLRKSGAKSLSRTPGVFRMMISANSFKHSATRCEMLSLIDCHEFSDLQMKSVANSPVPQRHMTINIQKSKQNSMNTEHKFLKIHLISSRYRH